MKLSTAQLLRPVTPSARVQSDRGVCSKCKGIIELNKTLCFSCMLKQELESHRN